MGRERVLDEFAAVFPHVNDTRVGLLRRFRSPSVAAKYWIEQERAPELATARKYHLDLLRGV